VGLTSLGFGRFSTFLDSGTWSARFPARLEPVLERVHLLLPAQHQPRALPVRSARDTRGVGPQIPVHDHAVATWLEPDLRAAEHSPGDRPPHPLEPPVLGDRELEVGPPGPPGG